MTDIVSREVRSRMMSGIKGTDTQPEITVRKLLHSRGYRFRVHEIRLPGKPDIVLPKYHAVIFVNGCFWHGHDCHFFRWPETRQDFWRKKIGRTKERDLENTDLLNQSGWRVMTVWECALRGKKSQHIDSVVDSIIKWLHSDRKKSAITSKN